MKKLIEKNLSGKKILILFILTNIVYALMLSVTIPKVMSYSGGMTLPDMMPAGYNSEYLNSLFSALGDKGRAAYLYYQLPPDMIYPFLFGVTYCLLLAYILKKLELFGGNLFYFCYLPLLSGLFDYFENFGIIALLKNYPVNSELLIAVTNLCTILKSIFTTLFFIVLIISLITLGLKKLKIFSTNKI